LHHSKHIIFNKAMALLISLSVILTAVIGVTIAQLVTQTPPLFNTFIPGEDPSGDLIIRKNVEHPFADDYVIPEGILFEFLVTLGDTFADVSLETSKGTVQTDESGSFTVALTHGEAIRILHLPEGTAVTVTELAKAGFTPADGATHACVIPRGEYVLTYTNAYTPEAVSPVNVEVTGTKYLEGRQWQEGDAFTFLLEYKLAGSEQWQELGQTTVAYTMIEVTDPETGDVTLVPKPDYDKFSFTDLMQSISYNTAGVYAFRVSEVDGTIAGITYDKVVSYFDVLVGDADMDGKLEIQSVTGYQNAESIFNEETNTFHVEVTVNNQYAPEGTAVVTVQLDKTVLSYSGSELSAAGYTFELYDENGELVATSAATSAAGESAIELSFAAKDAGKTFAYTLKETHSGENINGMEYDNTVYEILVSVVDNLDGTISAYIYEAPKQEQEDPGTDGETTPGDEQPEQETEASQTEEQETEESQIPVDATDTYCAPFVNAYDPVDTQVTFRGTKILEGRDLRNEEFTFLLYAAGEDFAISENAEPIRTTVNNAEGTFAFGALSYDKVGVYRYVIKEDNSNPNAGITYDTTAYYATVTVVDDNGVLKAEVIVTDVLGTQKEVTFTNTYKPSPTGITIKGTKELTGMELSEDLFRFLLYQADADYTRQGNSLDAALNSADGTFIFERLVFSQAGTYYYVVEEDSSAQVEGMTYDSTLYGVKIVVWDDEEGSLKADIAITELGVGAASEIRFINTYIEPTTPTEPSEPTETTEPAETTEPTQPSETTQPTEPDEPTSPSAPPKPSTPPTGDTTPVGWYIAMGCLSFTGLLILVVLGFTKRRGTASAGTESGSNSRQRE